MNYKYPVILSIAGSDSSGGAGIQADLKTITSLGCYGATVITALTAQNTQGVQGIFPASSEFIGRQLDSIFNDIRVDAVKIGMLHDSEVIKVVAEKLKEYNAINIVLDPVMVATSGDKLLQDEAIESLKDILMPIADIITPNVKEAELISGITISNKKNIEKAVNKIKDGGAKSILLKGGDLESSTSDDCLLYTESGQSKIEWFYGERIDTSNTHGTGCTLSSAIASYLGLGFDIIESIKKAKEYLTNALISAKDLKLGRGRGPVDHLCRFYEVF